MCLTIVAVTLSDDSRTLAQLGGDPSARDNVRIPYSKSHICKQSDELREIGGRMQRMSSAVLPVECLDDA